MESEPKIPFGFKRISGQSQKGDGIWNSTKFVKVRKIYPSTDPVPAILIRKCSVEQTELPVVDVSGMECLEVE